MAKHTILSLAQLAQEMRVLVGQEDQHTFLMKKKVWLTICLFLSLTAYSPKIFAQAALNQPVVQASSTLQQEKAKFLYGFYTAYMSSIIYNVEGLEEMLKEKYAERALTKRSTDADIFLDAQDCIEENLKTLSVKAIDDNWYRVFFLWSSPYPAVPTRQHTLLVRVGRGKNSYKIMDVKVEH